MSILSALSTAFTSISALAPLLEVRVTTPLSSAFIEMEEPKIEAFISGEETDKETERFSGRVE